MYKYILNSNLTIQERFSFAKTSLQKIPSVQPVKVQHLGATNLEQDTIPRIIWLYWDSEAMPTLVDKCIERIKKLNTNYEVRLLNKNTYQQYITIDNWNPKLPTPNFSDLIRLKLMAQYGGFWIDASSIFFESLEGVFQKISVSLRGLILFYNPLTTIDKKYPIVESWLIGCPPNNPFIRSWLSEFENCINSEDPLAYYSNRSDYKTLIQGMDNADYLLVYVSAQIVLRNGDYTMTLIDAGTLGCLYWFNNGKYPFDTRYYAKILAIMKVANSQISPFIKLTGICRKYLDTYLEKGLINKDSIYSHFINSI